MGLRQETTRAIAKNSSLSAKSSRAIVGRPYVIALTLVAGVLFLVLVALQLQVPSLVPAGAFPWASALFLLLLALYAETRAIRLAPGIEMSPGFLPAFVALAVAGPLASFTIAVISQLAGVRNRPGVQTLCCCASVGVISGVSGIVYWVVIDVLGGFYSLPTALVAAISLAVGVLYQAVGLGVVLPLTLLRGGLRVRRTWRAGATPFLSLGFFFLVISVGLISVYHLYLSHSPQASPADVYSTALVMLSLLPVVGLVYGFRLYGRERELAEKNEILARRNERLALQAIASQITALDLKDDYTARHSASVARWAADIAEQLGLSERECSLAHLAGLLHDVGKIGVPDELLKSPRRLDLHNWAQIERHSENGYRILRNIEVFGRLASVVLCHHEHYDGSGYPQGLRGEEIPLISRIICVADSYSAMVSERPYGPPLSSEAAMAELVYKRGSQFDPAVVDAFLAVLGERDEVYRCGLDVDFDLEVQQVRFLREVPPEMSKEEALTAASLAPDLPPPPVPSDHIRPWATAQARRSDLN